ncbi:unnamed protein product, partial [Closterium sp. NIES-53]
VGRRLLATFWSHRDPHTLSPLPHCGSVNHLRHPRHVPPQRQQLRHGHHPPLPPPPLSPSLPLPLLTHGRSRHSSC